MDTIPYSTHHMMNFQFLSVCHYITSFGKIFYDLNLITEEYQNYSVPILNSLFEYIQHSANESQAKRQLISRVLKGSDLYGGEEGETLDMKYIDETFQYIISSALFSKNGYIHGYLAKIISQAINITYSALKETVFEKLSKTRIIRDYCSSAQVNHQLTNLTIQRVFNDHVWSMFPEPENNMEIMDINYLYAMIGLKIIRSIPGDAKNQSFANYILLARLIDFQIVTNETFQVAVELYSTPALFHYAYKQKGKFNLKGIDGKFLQLVINEFLNFLKIFHESSFIEETMKSQIGKLNKVFIEFNNNDIAQFRNKFSNEILDVLYQLDLNSLEQLLIDIKIVEKINVNSTWTLLYTFRKLRNCSECIPGTGGIFIIFSLIENGRIVIYTIRQNDNTLTLLLKITNQQILHSVALNKIYFGENYPNYSTDLQQSHKNYTIFLKVIAKTLSVMQAKIFLTSANISKPERLKSVESFPPFFTCLEVVKTNNFTKSARICKPVIKSLLPIPDVGQNILTTVWNSKFTEIGEQILKNISKSEINYKRIVRDVTEMYGKINKFSVFSNNEIYTIDSRQTLKPGFELSLQITNSFRKILEGITQALDSRFSHYRNKNNLLLTMEFAIYLLNTSAVRNQYKKDEIFRYRYPGGWNYFGPLCTFSFGRIAEFRTAYKIQYKVPVVVYLNESDGKQYYRLYNPKTGEVYKAIFKLRKSNILKLHGLYSDEDFLKIIDLSTAYAN